MTKNSTYQGHALRIAIAITTLAIVLLAGVASADNSTSPIHVDIFIQDKTISLNNSGEFSVTILSTNGFDARNATTGVNTSSVRFEGVASFNDNNNSKPKEINLTLKFHSGSAIQCGNSRIVYLTGKTIDGRDIVGWVNNVTIVGCSYTSPGAPNITSFAPPSPVMNNVSDSMTFNISVNQTVDVIWYINGIDGTLVQSNISVTESKYTNNSASPGIWNVTVVANNGNGTAIQSWDWTVGKVDTFITVTSSQNNSVFGESVTFTVTVSATDPGAGTPTGTVTFKDGAATLGTGTLSSGQATFSTSTLSNGSHLITAEYGGDTNFNASTSSALIQTVNKADQTINFNPLSDKTYGDAPFDVSATASSGLTVSFTAAGNCGVLGTTVTIIGTGNCTITANQSGNGSYNPAPDVQQTFSIVKATASITVVPYSVTYDGNAHTATGTAMGVKGESLTGLDLTATTHTDAGTYPSDAWTFTDSTGNYNDTSGTVSDIIGMANPIISVTPYSVTYDGNAHAATGSATGVKGETLSGLDLSGTTHTNAGTFTDTWAFTDSTGNYNDISSTVSDSISKKDASVTPNAASKTYGDTDPALTGTLTGFLGTDGVIATYSRTVGEIVGTYTINAALGPAGVLGNYNITYNTATFTINKKDASVTPDANTKVYGSSDPALTGTLSGFLVGDSVTAIYTRVLGETVDGSPYTISATLSPAIVLDNYNITYSTALFTITKANPIISINNYLVTYDGNAHTATGSATGMKGETLSGLDLSGTTHTDAGDYPSDAWAFTDSTGNYNSTSGTIHDIISKTTASIAVTSYSVTYDGDAHTATVIATGAKGEDLSADVNLSGTTHTNAGDYPSDEWTFTDLTGNYNSTSGTVHDSISKVDATITVNGYTGVYDGNSHGASGTATGVGGTYLSASLDFGSGFTNVPGGTVHWTFTGGTNYNDASGDVNIVISKAGATIAVVPYSVTYDGNAHTATGTATGVKGESLIGLDLTGTTHTNAGDYPSDPWTFTDTTGNYNDEMGTVNDAISKATLTVTADDTSKEYGEPNPAFTASYSGFKNGETLATSGVTGDPSLTTLATATSSISGNPYTITAEVGTLAAGNYDFSFVYGKLTITKATLTITADDASREYGDANPTLTGKIEGIKNDDGITATYSTIADASTAVGTYDIVPAVVDSSPSTLGNYEVTLVNGKLTITKAILIVTADDKSRVYGEPNPTFTVSYSGFKNEETLATSGVSGSPSLTTTADPSSTVSGSPYAITVALGTLASEDYEFSFVNGNLAITKAQLKIIADNMSREYGNANPTLTGTIIGIKNSDGITATYSTLAVVTSLVGDYAIVPAAVDSDPSTLGNYNVALVDGNLTITKAETTTSLSSLINPSVSAQSVNFTATVSAVAPGAGIPNGTVQFKIDGSNLGLPVELSNSSATSIGNSSLSVGTHTITAEYSGDGNFNTSTSSALTQIVNTASTTTTSSQAGASSSSSGCGSGVITKENLSHIKQYETRDIVHISEGATVFRFTTLGIVNEAGFTAKTNGGCIAARGEILKERPSQAASDAPGTGTVYFNVWLGPWGYGESSKIETPYVVFSVPDEKNNESVKLMMYKNNSWIDLKTEKIDTGTYRAYTGGFGSFAIVETTETPSETPAKTSTQSTPTPVVITNEPAPQKPTNLALILVVFILIIGMIIGYRQYRKGLSRKKANLQK